MRRLMLLGLLALALPTAALANTVPFAFEIPGNLGTFASGSFSPGPSIFGSTGSRTFTVNGTLAGVATQIQIVTGTLSSGACMSGPFPTNGSCTFSTGSSVTVSENGTTVFSDSLTMGSISRTGCTGGIITRGSCTYTLEADLVPRPGCCGLPFVTSGTVGLTGTTTSRAGRIFTSAATADVRGLTPVPEPGTLGLLGTGLIGLAGLARRKLKA